MAENESTVKTIPELPPTTALADADLLVVDDGARTYKITWAAFKALLGCVTSFEADPDQETYPGALKLTLANTLVLRAVPPHDSGKQDKLTFDQTPTSGSSNPVTSGGVFTALSEKLDASAYTNFTGATAQDAGKAGIVPAPAAGGERYLSSAGAWQAPDSAPSSGSNKLITSAAVYDAVTTILANFTGAYSASATYAVGSYCVYNGALYRCTTAIMTAEAWTAAHWTATTVGAELLALSAAIAANTSAENITFNSAASSHTAGSVAAAIANLNSLVSAAQTNITKLLARTDMEAGSVTLSNNQVFPFNSSQVTVPLSTTRDNQNYIVDYEVTAAVGNVGDIIVSAKLVNGFKIEYTGSATSVTVKYQVLGGMS